MSRPPASLTNSLLDNGIFGAMAYALPFISSAARRTAVKIRTWLPQRQTKLSNALRISASVGWGFSSSSAFVVSTQPFRQ